MQYLYLVSCQKYFKIGITTHVPNRLAQLYTGNPFDMDVVVVYGFDSAEPVERSIHQKFSNRRIRGEWFELSAMDIDTFYQICTLLDGKEVYYEEAVFDGVEDEMSKSSNWRTARKSMNDTDIRYLAEGSIDEIVKKYFISERTASNWRSYAKDEISAV